MDKKNENALVPRPPSAVGKAVPGVKRILSGMVSDTLALAKREQCEPPLLEMKNGQRKLSRDQLKRLEHALRMKRYLRILKEYRETLQTKSSQTKFRIGDYEWCEPDYRQIVIWAEETGLKPEQVVERLLDPGSLRELPANELTISKFFKEPLFVDGKLLKVNLNLRLLRCSRLDWAKHLEITCLCINAGEITSPQFGSTPGRM